MHEIERKFLVRNNTTIWQNKPCKLIQQGYLIYDNRLSIRIRITNGCKAILSLKKGLSKLTKLEFEYEIPFIEALILIDYREGGLIQKLRYSVPWENGLSWDIDVFLGDNYGLVMAEIEIPSEDTIFNLPKWIGPEVTYEPRYSNGNLAKIPYQNWRD